MREVGGRFGNVSWTIAPRIGTGGTPTQTKGSTKTSRTEPTISSSSRSLSRGVTLSFRHDPASGTEKEARGDRTARPRPLSVVIDVGGDPYAEEKRASVLGNRELITTDHKILNLDDDKEMIKETLSSYKKGTRIGYTVFKRKPKMHKKQKPGRILTDSSHEFINACQELQCTHATNTSQSSETHGIAERAVRHVKGAPIAMVQRGLRDGNPHAAKCPPRATLSKMKEEQSKFVWSVSDTIYRHHEVHRTKLYIPDGTIVPFL